MQKISLNLNNLKTEFVPDYVRSNCIKINNWSNFECVDNNSYNPVATLYLSNYDKMFKSLFHDNDSFGI